MEESYVFHVNGSGHLEGVHHMKGTSSSTVISGASPSRSRSHPSTPMPFALIFDSHDTDTLMYLTLTVMAL